MSRRVGRNEVKVFDRLHGADLIYIAERAPPRLLEVEERKGDGKRRMSTGSTEQTG